MGLSGFEGQRRILNNQDDIGPEIESQRGLLPSPIFQKAVVVDVLINPTILTPTEISDLEKSVSTPELVKRAPYNSIIARVISRQQDFVNSRPRIFFPASSFHAEPVKPGEQVFIFFIDPTTDDQIGYWLGKIPQPLDVDDLNFTHADRKFKYHVENSIIDRFNGLPPAPPDFENGVDGLSDATRTLSGLNDYKDIISNAKSKDQIIKEPVARFARRPGDHCLLGSNGTRLVLGMDRPTTNLTAPQKETPAIDIVAGYGSQGTPTAPKTIQNILGDLEVDKVPEKNNAVGNPLEGEPDFINDKSRIYVAGKTNADLNFQVSVPGIGPSPIGPAIVEKSDQIRILGRQDVKIIVGNSGIVIDQNGNVSIVNSGQVNIGSAAPALGVARLNDEITINAITDRELITFLSQVYVFMEAVGGALKTLGQPGLSPSDLGIAGPPISIKGIISKASQKVKSE